ncbi:MAG: sorbosone dehydrogenase family protein [Cyclobacteriaceae bacterium]
MRYNISLLFFIALLTFSCKSHSETVAEANEKAEKVQNKISSLKLPAGFEISVFASSVQNARSLALGRNGTIFVGSRRAGKVYALVDENKDGKSDKTYVIASGLNDPNGVAFRNGSLYVAEISELNRYDDIESKLANPPKPVTIYDDYPRDNHHGQKVIAFGPDDKLYIPQGAPCNICENKKEVYASITRMNPDGSGREIFAHGVRNSVGLAWHPETGELWFTDNGRDNLGDNMPPCELNYAPKMGMHFGYPYCHGSDIGDPEFGHKRSCDEFIAPARKLGAHVAPLGLKFYTGDMFPEKYRNQIFIPEHGSWNRRKKIGYRVSMVKLEGNRAVSYDTFIDGWLDEKEQEAWGRPVDLLVLPDGSMLLSDDKSDTIYRITYSGK